VAYKIPFTEDALVDLEIILYYVCADNPSDAERFGASLLNYIELLESFPRIGVPVPSRPGVRKILHSPVRIYYRLHEDRSLIEILHLGHGARKDPPSGSR
jgi:plasmid stabilization system protein ParE